MTNTWKVNITNVVSASRPQDHSYIWISPELASNWDDPIVKLLMKCERAVLKLESTLCPVSSTSLKKGFILFTLHEDKYVRGEVLHVLDQDSVSLLLLDYGDIMTKKIYECKHIPEELQNKFPEVSGIVFTMIFQKTTFQMKRRLNWLKPIENLSFSLKSKKKLTC